MIIMKSITIGASVITMDHLNFQRDVKIAQEVGVDYLHIDVMDDHMVPRFGIYPEVIEQICSVSKLPMDVHLMIENVESFVDRYSDFDNIEYISFHADENQSNLYRIADLIRKFDKKPVLVFNLSSNIKGYFNVLNDEIWHGMMLMGIHPGVLDQKPRPQAVINNLEQINQKVTNSNVLDFIQIDGAVNAKTIPSFISKGASNLICGSSTLYKGISFRDLSDEKIHSKVRDNMNIIRKLIDAS